MSMTKQTQAIPWWRPKCGAREQELVREVLESNYLNEGAVTERFEAELAQRLGCQHVVCVTSGTAALFAALVGLGIGPGDEVLVPDITFIATANAVRLTGAWPVLVDVDPQTLNMCPAAARRAVTTATKAIVPVHVSGRSADLPALTTLAEQCGLALVEDAAEALLSCRNQRPLGTWGDAGCFSFSPNKLITTGQGGAVATNDDRLAARLREIKDQGRPQRGTGGDDPHPALGWNFKLTNLQAAVGLAQLEQLDERVARQRRTYAIYDERLADCSTVRLPGFDLAGGECPLWVDVECADRDGLDRHLANRGFGCRRFWHPLHTQTPYRHGAADLPNAARLGPRMLWLPTAFQLTDDDVYRACDLIESYQPAQRREAA